jgi:hypothetical protein
MPIISSKASMSAQAYGLFGVTAAPYTLVGAYDALATVTVPSGGASSITFSAIPQTGYSHLQIRGITNNTSGGFSLDTVIINGNTSNYSDHYLYGDGSSASAGANGGGGTASYAILTGGTSTPSNVFAGFIMDVLDYKNSNKNKVFKCLSGMDANGSGYIWFQSGANYTNTNPVTSLTFTPSSGNFAQYTQFSLYGIR